MKLRAAVLYTSVTLTVAVLTSIVGYTMLTNNPTSWLIVFWIWAFGLWSMKEFLNSCKAYKWGLHLYNIFLPRKMVVELTDFHGNKQFTIVSPCNTEWPSTKLAWEGFIFPTTDPCPLYLRSDGSVFHPNWVAYWQPVKKDLRTEHFLRNSETIIKLQSQIKKAA
jgi:hypothetical protein